MFHKRAVVCDGVRYNSLADFRRKNNLSKWLRLEDILKLDSVTIEKAYKVHNQQFDTLREISDFYKVDFSRLTHSFYKGDHSLEYIVDKLQQGHFIKKIPVVDHLGQEFNTLLEMCSAYNISYTTYARRKKQGLSLKQILTSPKAH